MLLANTFNFVTGALSASTSLLAVRAPRPEAGLPLNRCDEGSIRVGQRVANFDELPAETSPRTQVPQPYEALRWDGFFVESYVNEKSFIPASGKQYAVAYNWRSAGISSDYDGSFVKRFDLKSLYYACDQGVPQDTCSVQITGIVDAANDGQSTSMVSEVVIYPAIESPATPGTLKLKQVTFGPEWTSLQSVNFTLTQNGEPANQAGLILDQVEFDTADCLYR